MAATNVQRFSGDVILSGNMNLQKVSNTATIKLDSNVVVEFPRSKKLIKYPRVALTAASGESSGYQGYYVTESSNAANDLDRTSWKAFNMTFDNDPDNTWTIDEGTNYDGSNSTYNPSADNPVKNLGTGAVDGEWIKLQLPHKIRLEYMKIWLRDNDPQRIPEDWKLYGSDDNSNWTELFSKTGQGTIKENTYSVNATSMYNYLAVVVTKISVLTNYFRIVELEFFGTPEYDPEAHGTDVVIKSYPNVPNTDWLEVYYDGQDYTQPSDFAGSGGVIDKAGGDQNGTAGTGVGFDTTYKAFTFNGTSQYITASYSDLPNITDHTLAFWMKVDSTATANDYVVTLGVNDSGKMIAFNLSGGTASGKLHFDNWNSGVITETDVYQIGQWVHVVGTMSGTATGNLKTQIIYVNGVKQSCLSAGVGTLTLSGRNELTIGARPNNAGSGTLTYAAFFDGSVANFRLFNRALTTDEIYQLYAYQKEDFGYGDLSMTLKAGRLGIGTSEPRAALDVRGSVIVNGGGVPIIYDTGSWTSGTSIELGTIQWEKYKYHRITCRFFGTDAPPGKSGWFNVRIRGKKVGSSAYLGSNTYESFASAIKKTSSTTLTSIYNGSDGPLAIYRSDPKTVNNGDCFLIIDIANTLNGRQQVQFTSSYTWATVGYVQVIGGFHNYTNGTASYEKIKLLFEEYSSTSTVGSSSGDWTITGYT